MRTRIISVCARMRIREATDADGASSCAAKGVAVSRSASSGARVSGGSGAARAVANARRARAGANGAVPKPNPAVPNPCGRPVSAPAATGRRRRCDRRVTRRPPASRARDFSAPTRSP
ncbi:hypothetical protein C6P96_22065 [Burkholderia multivorans]|nr:hypothetical protein C6P95_27370 [Burkholderia multivorans]PRF09248.1 hypothetical protein C6P96_22065 [Burkholderia multivorans]